MRHKKEHTWMDLWWMVEKSSVDHYKTFWGDRAWSVPRVVYALKQAGLIKIVEDKHGIFQHVEEITDYQLNAKTLGDFLCQLDWKKQLKQELWRE